MAKRQREYDPTERVATTGMVFYFDMGGMSPRAKKKESERLRFHQARKFRKLAQRHAIGRNSLGRYSDA